MRSSKGNFRENEEANWLLFASVAVSGCLGGAVSEVKPFAEQIAGARSFGWGDLESVLEDADEIGESGAVPEQLVVVEGLEGLEAQVLAGPSDLEDILDLESEASVLVLIVGPLERLLDEFEVLVEGTQDLDLGPE
jgi:hypothetical protein